MSRLFTISVDSLQDAVTQTTTTTGTKTLKTNTARAIEFWVNLTAIAGGTTVDFVFETSLDGANFAEQGRISGVTAVAVKTISFNRADNALGTVVRLKTIIAGGAPSVTYDIKMGRME